MREAVKYLEKLETKSDSLSEETLLNVAKTSMSSKIIGVEDETFAKMALDALLVQILSLRFVQCLQ